jgi:hypothetical protein
MVTSVSPILSLTEAFLLPPLGATVRGICAKEKATHNIAKAEERIFFIKNQFCRQAINKYVNGIWIITSDSWTG